VYFEIDDNDSVTVEFKTKDTSTAKWDVMASQIECSSIYRPPHGCLQYHTGDSGSFSTFNYAATSGRHINSHDYSICIRQEEGNHNQVTSFIYLFLTW